MEILMEIVDLIGNLEGGGYKQKEGEIGKRGFEGGHFMEAA